MFIFVSMKIGFNIDFGYRRKYEMYERDNEGGNFYQILSNLFKGGKYGGCGDRLDAVLSNPASLMVLSLNADLFSMGKIDSFENEELKELNVLYNTKKKPNEFQTWKQFLWEYMFWNQLGVAYLCTPSNKLDNPMYWLKPNKIEFSKSLRKELSGMPLNAFKFSDKVVKYTLENGETRDIPLKEITPFFDLSNGLSGSWFEGTSKIDALYGVIKNNNRALTAKYGNLDFSDKFIISGNYDPTSNLSDFYTTGDVEKENVEKKVTGNKKVHSVKMPIKIERFTSNMAQLKLDESFLADYFIIGKMFNIPADVLESKLTGSTYNNQEKSTGKHIEYALAPKGEDLTDAFEFLFGFEDLRMTWKHLSFNQVFEKEREEKKTIQLDNLKLENEIQPIEATELKKRIEEINNQ